MPFEYTPFVNRYVGTMSDLMAQETEARNLAALSAAEVEAGAVRRVGDLTAAKWRGLGQDVAGGVESYLTEKREQPLREHAAWQREQERLGVERQDLAATLLGETLAGAPDPEEVQPYERPRFRGIPSRDTEMDRDAAGNLVRAEPALEEPAPSGPSRGPFHRFDVRGFVQAAAEGQFLPQASTGLQTLISLNTETERRFTEAYDRSKETFRQLLDQSPEALMSGGAQFIEHFSRELGELPQFQGLINALETGDPRAFKVAVRRYTDTPIDAPYQPDATRPELNIWSGERTAATQGPDISGKTQPMTVVTASGRRIEGATQITVGDKVSWLEPSGEPMSDDDPVVRVIDDQGGLSYTQRVNRAEAERQFPEAFRQALSREWQTEGSTYDQAIETVRRLIAELAATDPAAAASLDPAIARAYVGRLHGRPLTIEQELLLDMLGRRGDGVATGPPPTGPGS
jgi:hypothetical protein